jgi:hypothetical protein
MLQYLKSLALLLLLSVGVGSMGSANISQQASDLIQNKINSITSNAKIDCGDSFELGEAAVKLTDLDLDGNIDLGIIDESGYSCPELGASYYCGSGGCSIHLITVDDYLQGHAQGWEIITTQFGENLILMSLHGSACDEPGFLTCYKVLSISEGKLVYQNRKLEM